MHAVVCMHHQTQTKPLERGLSVRSISASIFCGSVVNHFNRFLRGGLQYGTVVKSTSYSLRGEYI